MSTDFIKPDRTMFDSYAGLRLPLDGMKTRDDLCSERPLTDNTTYNHHSIDDILGYRRMQENMKGSYHFLNILPAKFLKRTLSIF